jgi:hypothetical protein
VSLGERTYCPVSGVVFEVKETSPVRSVSGRPVYFCCEKCAMYFSEHGEQVSGARGLPH